VVANRPADQYRPVGRQGIKIKNRSTKRFAEETAGAARCVVGDSG
jgi:hypothetical protein